MKKTNFTLKRSLVWMTMFVLGLLSSNSMQAQCTLACNDNVQVSTAPASLDNPNACEISLSLDMVLEGANDFVVFDPVGTCQASRAILEVRNGNVLIAADTLNDVSTPMATTAVTACNFGQPVAPGGFGWTLAENDCAESGTATFRRLNGFNFLDRDLRTTVTLLDADDNPINSCWGSITVEDKVGPIYDCAILLLNDDGRPFNALGVEVNNPGLNGNDTIEVFVPCSFDLSLIPTPLAFDNCDIDPTEFLISETVTQTRCDGQTIMVGGQPVQVVKTLSRRYGSVDFYGNQGAQIVVDITLYQTQIRFPDDINWTCEQFEIFPNIVEATSLHPMIIAAAEFLDASGCQSDGVGGDRFPGEVPYAGFFDLPANDPMLLDTVFGYIPNASVPAYWADREALDVDLDPFYDDNFDNQINDNSPFCGTATAETDEEFVHNISALRVGCNATAFCPNVGRNTPVLQPAPFANPMFPSSEPPIFEPPFCLLPQPLIPTLGDVLPHPTRGLEDADLLEQSGSGVPAMSTDHGDCNFTITFSDQRFETCDGQGTDRTFKIFRTWTVLNWCSGVVETDVQIIKVEDRQAPVITFNDDDNGDFIADETEVDEEFGNNDGYNDLLISDQVIDLGSHSVCASGGLIDVPTVFDRCAGVQSLTVFTPAGEATPVEANGQVIGFRIPAPFLEVGIHDIIFTASDGCGNFTTAIKRVQVVDGTPPVNVCREVTQIALSALPDGITSIPADFFDEGSFDFCSDVFLKVRKMELGTCDNVNIDKPEEVNHVRGPNCDIVDPEEWFDDDVKFCCDEVGTTVNVILRAYDRDPNFLVDCGPGNRAVPADNQNDLLHARDACSDCRSDFGSLNTRFNDCMIEVLIEDKVRPTCIAPDDVNVTCAVIPENLDLDDADLLNDLFGEATVLDNCDASIEVLRVNNNLNQCGVGTLVRFFSATDASGNENIGACRQTINVNNITNYCITFPVDFEGECDNAVNPADLEFAEIGCDLLSVSREVNPTFNAGGPAGDECRKEIVTWSVINWCEYDGVADAVVLSRDLLGDGIDDGEFCSSGFSLVYQEDTRVSYPSVGFYMWDQLVTITDNTAPVVSYNGDVKFGGGDFDEDPCTGQVDIAIDVTEECTENITTRWELTAFSSTFAGATFSGDNAISGRFPLGTHTARFFVSDDCGNTSFIDVTFDVVDTKAPTPVCFNGLSVDVMPASGMVQVWASDFDASSFDFCQDIKLNINRIDDVNGDGQITEDDHVTIVPTDDQVLLTCDDIGTLVFVQLWVSEVPGDGCNDSDFCTTFIEVQDNNQSCNGMRSISGSIKTQDGEPVSDVDVTLSGDMSNTFTTANNGEYLFTGLVPGNDYTVTPMKNDDVRNGVSTFDLAMISKHILNVQPLDSPYKVLAADANNSRSVTTLDLVAIRKVILFVSNEFPNNTSWRFIDENHIFTNAANPWNTVIPEAASFNNIDANVAAGFACVKVGDVSGDAVAHNIGTIEERTFNGTFFLNTDDKAFKAGETVEVTFNGDLNEVLGYQATINFNAKSLDLVDVVAGESTSENFGLAMVDDGIITTSWNGVAASNNAFTLVFNAQANGTLSNEIAISSEYTTAEAYSNEGLQNVGINFGTSTSTVDYALYQNTPNPFKGETTIRFNLPKATTATLTVSDVSGKVIEVIKGDYNRGDNTVTLNSENLVSGILYYQLDTEDFSATKKMIIIE